MHSASSRFFIKMLSLYETILILGLISGVYMETCPAREDLVPCECKEYSQGIVVVCLSSVPMKWYDLQMLQGALNSLKGKNKVDLRLDGYNSMPSNIFSGIGIQKLKFTSCRMDSLTNDNQTELTGLENYLEELDISRCSTVPAKLNLGHLKKLKTLYLWSNNIAELSDDWLINGLPSLETLEIQRNNITKVGRYAFSELNNLKRLRLEDNRFGSLKRSMFPSTADRLTKLLLANNALTDLPVDIFRWMPSIEYVFLERNRITTLDERTWSPVWQLLRGVSLDGNNIICDKRLHWISKSKKGPWVSGNCSAPKEFEGKSLDFFIRQIKKNISGDFI